MTNLLEVDLNDWTKECATFLRDNLKHSLDARECLECLISSNVIKDPKAHDLNSILVTASLLTKNCRYRLEDVSQGGTKIFVVFDSDAGKFI